MSIKIQRKDKGADRKRARYHSSMMDAKLLQKSTDFGKLPETYAIFVTEHDVMVKEKLLMSLKEYTDPSRVARVNRQKEKPL